MFKDVFIDYLPSIDLHGYDRESAIVIVKDFINENYLLGNDKIVIIHGKGMGILKQEISNYLKQDKKVLEYHIDNFNDGITVVNLIDKHL